MTNGMRNILVVSLIAFILLSLIGIIRTGYLVQAHPESRYVYNLEIDTPTYTSLAQSVAAEGVSAIPIQHPPGYIFYLSAIYRLFDSPIYTAKLLNVFSLVLIAIASGFIFARVFSPIHGIMTATFVCNSDALRAYAATIQYEIFTTMLLWATIFAWWSLENKITHQRLVPKVLLGGILLAVTSLTREPLALLFVAFLISTWRLEHPRRFALVSLFALTFFIVLGSWILYQYNRFGVLTFISQKSEINFPIGNNPNATGTFNLVRTGIGTPSGWEYIRTEPWGTLRLAIRKVGYLFGFLRDGWNTPNESVVIWWKLFGGQIDYGWVMAFARAMVPIFAFSGMFIAIRSYSMRKQIFPLLIFLALYILSFIPFIGSYRFLIPVLPAFYGFASCSIIAIFTQIWHSEFRKTIGVGVALFLIVILLSPTQLSMQIPSTMLDGNRVTDIEEENNKILYAPGEPRPRLIGYFPPEYFPHGVYRLTIEYRSQLNQVNRPPAKIVVRDRDRKAVTTKDLTMSEAYAIGTTDFGISRNMPLSLEIRSTKNSGDLWIKKITIHRVSAS